MVDSKYRKNKFIHWLKDDEIVGLSLLAVLHLPLAWFFPFAYGVLLISAVHYFFLHKISHSDHLWAREHLSHHYDHHMGKNQGMNWGVRADWVDKIFGTREVYKGTKREIINYKRVIKT